MRGFSFLFAAVLAAACFVWGSTASAAAPHVLIVSGHPHLDRSLANRTIIETVRRELPDAEIIDLGQMYPNYTFDVPREQERVGNADIIVMQYPAYWYVAPALMKKWQEDVLTFGFAHNAEGGLLGGRTLIVSVTSGAPESDYALGARMNRPDGGVSVPGHADGGALGD